MTVQDQKSFLPAFADQTAHFFAPLQREIDRVMGEFARGAGGEAFLPSPDMDLKETPEQIELTAELPGLTAEDVSVTLEDGVLTISGEKRGETKETRKGYRMLERRFGAFSRSVRLPVGAIADKVEASLKDGVLKVTAPRDGVSAARNVPIEVAKG